MSGGSYDYAFWKVDDFADALQIRLDQGDDPLSITQTSAEALALRQRFVEHLRLVRDAMRAIEWVDSCDYSPGDELEALRAVFQDRGEHGT
jgi:hypothetical protein